MNKKYALNCLTAFLNDVGEPLGLREMETGNLIEVEALGDGCASVFAKKYIIGDKAEKWSETANSAEELFDLIEEAVSWMGWDERDLCAIAEQYPVDADDED